MSQDKAVPFSAMGNQLAMIFSLALAATLAVE
jgi:hypothetical protein